MGRLLELVGGQAIGDFQTLTHLGKLIGPVASTPTVRRCLDEVDGLRVTRIHQVVRRFPTRRSRGRPCRTYEDRGRWTLP